MKLLRWLCFFLAISLAGSGVVQAQTIADTARQERERRKAVESETGVRIPIVISVTPASTAGSIALEKATHDRDVARKALADAQQNLADLEDQFRRSGGLPGWSRPR